MTVGGLWRLRGALMECYRTTYWEDYGDDIEGFTDNNDCPLQEGSLLPKQRTMNQQGHQVLLNLKRNTFMAGNNEDAQEIQKELRKELRRAKACYKNRIEGKLQQESSWGTGRHEAEVKCIICFLWGQQGMIFYPSQRRSPGSVTSRENYEKRPCQSSLV